MRMKFYEFFVNYPDNADYNLYIVWDKKQCLYVGISLRNVWNRWFDWGGHLNINEYGEIKGNSDIGRVIEKNNPKSLNFDVELLEIDGYKWQVEKKERCFIKELKPLFNTTHREPYTDDELKLYKYYSNPYLELSFEKPHERS